MYKISLRKLEERMKKSFLGWISTLHKIEKSSAVYACVQGASSTRAPLQL